MNIKKRAFEIVEKSARGDTTSAIFDWFILSLIVINIIALCLETLSSFHLAHQKFFDILDATSVVIFTIEYIIRIWSCTANARYLHPIGGRIRFMLKPIILIDLLAILPFYLAFLNLDLRALRAMRLFRFLRILKLVRYSDALKTLGKVLKHNRQELSIALTLVLITVLISSSVLYFAENEAQPDVFSSIPESMWWSLITVTTVGYGDAVPITPIGKIIGGLTAIMGIGCAAIFTAILGAGMVEEMNIKNTQRICPHCGESVQEYLDSQTKSKTYKEKSTRRKRFSKP